MAARHDVCHPPRALVRSRRGYVFRKPIPARLELHLVKITWKSKETWVIDNSELPRNRLSGWRHSGVMWHDWVDGFETNQSVKPRPKWLSAGIDFELALGSGGA